MRCFLVLFAAIIISGCTSFGKGIAEAILEKGSDDSQLLCEIIGKGFEGVEPSLIEQQGVTKLLKIHGVGDHAPGYSAEFLDKLAIELDLPVRNSDYKEISLVHPEFPDKKLGVLQIKRLLNEDETKELIFYELTWSEITAKEKRELEYDTSGEYSYRRAEINDFLKHFSNETSPDPMLYLGLYHEQILASFTTAFCWMISADWDDLPVNSSEYCNPFNAQALTNLEKDDFLFVTHSLGSRIAIDGMQNIATKVSDENEKVQILNDKKRFIETLRTKRFTFFMLSNQLPLLQMGRHPAEVTRESEAYCNKSGEHYESRIVDKMKLVAFSDPNDVLSYTIPKGFAENKLDSRLCIETSNVIINVTDVIDLLGFGRIANPIAAHTAYDSDDRVVALIAGGIGNDKNTELLKKKCKWTRTID